MDIPVRMNIIPKVAPTVSLSVVENIAYNKAVFKGAIVSVGSSRVIRHGFCWGCEEEPVVGGLGVCNLGDTEDAKDFTYSVVSLEPNTTYYVRAYAENMEGVNYSNQMKFQTRGIPQLAVIETGIASDIQAHQALLIGNIVNMGNTNELIQYGHVWGIVASPTVANSKTELGLISSTGAFNSLLTGLSPNTRYFVRAYATNSVGTSYGEEISFTTSFADVIVNTKDVKNVTHNTATCLGRIDVTGGHVISEKGFCWGLSQNPIITGNVVVSTSASNEFSADITGLSENTNYYVRAYVRTANSQIFYGNEIVFSTTEKNINIGKEGFGEENDWSH